MSQIPLPDYVRAHLLDFFGVRHRSEIDFIADHYQGRFASIDEFYAARARESVGEDALTTMPVAEIERLTEIHRRDDLVLHLDAPADDEHPPGVFVFLFPEPLP